MVTVCRNEWQGKVGKPKGGKIRHIPLTARLDAAVKDARHLRGKRLLWQANGKKVGITTLQSWLETACRRAGLGESRNLHKLRHTFCSHLAMRGAAPRAIQELAGHADIKTTMRYMHLSPGSTESAIALLERGAGVDSKKMKSPQQSGVPTEIRNSPSTLTELGDGTRESPNPQEARHLTCQMQFDAGRRQSARFDPVGGNRGATPLERTSPQVRPT